MNEEPLIFECVSDSLVGVLSLPDTGAASMAVLVVVGGPQYRVGSHRHFTLLARALAARGIPALRFDYRGMGDSEGTARIFDAISDDIRAAIDALCTRLPAVTRVVLWGLCDAASAILFYAWRDPRVAGIVVLNPWVYTPQGEAKALLRHYYVRRLMTPAFWIGVLRGESSIVRSIGSLWGSVTTFLASRAGRPSESVPAGVADGAPLPERMANGLERCNVPVLLILSGKDLTAQQFRDCVAVSPTWQRLLSSQRVERHEVPDAAHTFSSRIWRDQVTAWTVDWCASLEANFYASKH